MVAAIAAVEIRRSPHGENKYNENVYALQLLKRRVSISIIDLPL